MPIKNTRQRDLIGGALFALIGAGTISLGSSYRLGSLTQMGPGFFPVALGCVMSLCGLGLMLVAALDTDATPVVGSRPEWRGWLCICASIIAFVPIAQHFGMVPATVAIVFVSALGDNKNTLASAAALAATLAVVAALVFNLALSVQLPLFSWNF